MKKTIVCATLLVVMIITAFSFNWVRPAAVAVLVTAIASLVIIIPEIRSTLYEIKRNKD